MENVFRTRLPDLSNLRIDEATRRPAPTACDVDAPLYWSADAAAPVVSYWSALRTYRGKDVHGSRGGNLSSTKRRRDGDDEASDTGMAAEGGETEDEDLDVVDDDRYTEIDVEEWTQLLWYRFCSVPSEIDGKLPREVEDIPGQPLAWPAVRLKPVLSPDNVSKATGEYALLPHEYTQRLEHVNRDAEPTENDERAQRRERRAAMLDARNKLYTVGRLASRRPPSFGPFGQRKPESDLKTWFVARYALSDATSPYSGKLLGDTDSWEFDHVVPQVWLRPLGSVYEFHGAANDPVNIIRVFARENRSKGENAVKFEPSTIAELRDGLQWTPRSGMFDPKKQAAVARIVTYMALTYPFVCSSREVLANGTSSVGMPMYARQADSIMRLCLIEPELDEIESAWSVWRHTKWCNPLVFSKGLRDLVSRNGNPLNELFRKRLAGVDAGSRALLKSLKKAGVEFREPGSDRNEHFP